MARAIGPALAAGRVVICDRFLDSSRAYQGAAGLTDAEVLDLHRIGSGGLVPDMTLLIEVAPTIAAMRLQDRDGNDSDAIGGRGIDYHAAVAERFAQLAESERARFARIEGGGAPAEVHERIMRAIAPLLTAGA